jgi:hypothetical protein
MQTTMPESQNRPTLSRQDGSERSMVPGWRRLLVEQAGRIVRPNTCPATGPIMERTRMSHPKAALKTNNG